MATPDVIASDPEEEKTELSGHHVVVAFGNRRLLHDPTRRLGEGSRLRDARNLSRSRSNSARDADEKDLEAPEGILAVLLERYKRDRPLICLDSAGGIGWLEFQEVLRLQEGHPFLLFLDDINHVKHYRSKLFVERTPEFTVFDSDWNEGWMVAAYEGS